MKDDTDVKRLAWHATDYHRATRSRCGVMVAPMFSYHHQRLYNSHIMNTYSLTVSGLVVKSYRIWTPPWNSQIPNSANLRYRNGDILDILRFDTDSGDLFRPYTEFLYILVISELLCFRSNVVKQMR